MKTFRAKSPWVLRAPEVRVGETGRKAEATGNTYCKRGRRKREYSETVGQLGLFVHTLNFTNYFVIVLKNYHPVYCLPPS